MDRTRTPADPRAADRGRLESSLLALKEVSVLLVDCMETPGLNGLRGQSYTSAGVEEVNGDRDPELAAQIHSCGGEEEGFQVDGGSDEDERLSDSWVQKTKSQHHQKHVAAAERRGGDRLLCLHDDANGAERNQQEPEPEPRRHRCGESFMRRSHLVRHRRCHCSETETLRTKRHENGDGDETQRRRRRHSCAQCHKSFYLPRALRQHLLTHSGERAFGCTVCGNVSGGRGL
ncbi:hypothetical protein INR49_001213 [Caranx melampygus]|nr:hypothetical protein INR49_001213 [Caranx melampygus]